MSVRNLVLGVLAFAVGLLSACSEGNGSADSTPHPTSEVSTSSIGAGQSTVSGADDEDSFHLALDELGIDRGTAPALAVTLAGASYCGAEDVTHNGLNAEIRQCFADAHRQQLAAVFISAGLTNEGDPLAFVYRTEGGLATFFFDHTRDPLSSGGWDVGSCRDVTIDTSPPPERALVFVCPS